MMDAARGPEKRLHVVIGEPDPENCAICRAHGVAPLDEGIPGENAGGIQVQELSLGEMLRCPCPLCNELRQGEAEL